MARLLPPAAMLSSALALTACSGLFGGTATSNRPSPPEEWHPPAEMLEKYVDKNGIVTRAAMEAGLRVDFAKVDVSHTGCLDQDEVRTINEVRWKENESTASPLIDFRHTGCIDFDEFAATPRSLFDQLDKKGDGKLTRDELHPGQKPNHPPQSSEEHAHHGNGQTTSGP